ncbi:MAG: hypothetical protein GEU28_05025 [Dehalococcoidia bacterium]|nr:hypothetical protein [Dehalococcoidia bacterium]
MDRPAGLRAGADLHIHTSDGDGMASISEIFDHVTGSTDLAVIAITEHDDIRPSLAALEAWARGRYPFELVTGVEVTTRSGHVLGLFVDRPIRSFQTTGATVAAIHDAGGLAVIPHPLSWLTRSVGARVMARLLQDPETTPDAIEISQSPAARLTRRRVLALNESAWMLPMTGSSDAHFPPAIGGAVTSFEGSSAQDLRRSIESGAVQPRICHSLSPAQLGWRNVVRQQWRGMSVTPRKIIGPRVGRLLRRTAS